MKAIPGYKKCPKCGFYYEARYEKCPNCRTLWAERLTVLTLLLVAVLLAALFGCALRPPNAVCVPYEVYQKRPQ